MAGTLRASFSLSVSNGNFADSISLSNQSYVQTNPGGGNPGTIGIGTSEETVAFSELTSEGWLFIHNLDDTNFVQVGFATGVYGIRLRPNEFAAFRLEPTTTLYCKADTAECRVNFRCFED